MTREEAIRHIEAAKLMLLGKDNQPISDLYYALNMAIEALKQPDLKTLWYTLFREQIKNEDWYTEDMDKVIEGAIKSSVYEDKAERKTHSLVFDNEHEYQKFKNVLDTGWEPNF